MSGVFDFMAQRPSSLARCFAWTLLIGILAVTAISLLTSRYGWPIYLELLSHFQLQYWVLSAITVVIIGLTRCKIPVLVGLLCVAALSAQILPWYLPPSFAMPNDGNFRILIVNLNTQNTQYEAALAYANQVEPDLALFMEVNDTWRTRLDKLLADMPYSSGQTRSDNFGILLYSRHPLSDVQIKGFAEESTPSLIGEVTVDGRTISLVGTHPLPPVKPFAFHSRNRQLHTMGQYVQTLATPVIVMGDLNITMWSPYYKQMIRNTGLKNSRKGFGLRPSWPTQGTYRQIPHWAPLLFSIPIDHCLLSPDLTVENIRVGPNLGSDHRPVVVDLRL
ncbi:MAG: endonuclease/exonuclease/phosphatase family protein [Leptolyngbyaceae cyanobacterium]